jgi:hypothetical protein
MKITKAQLRHITKEELGYTRIDKPYNNESSKVEDFFACLGVMVFIIALCFIM